MPNTTEPTAMDEEPIKEPIVSLGIIFIVIALAVTALLMFGAIANCVRKRVKSSKSSGFEMKSSARRHGPNAFVKDADFSYIDIESRTNSKKKKREMERYRSLERYHAVKVDNLNTVSSQTQTGVSLSASNRSESKSEIEEVEGAVMVNDSSSSGEAGSFESTPPPQRLTYQLFDPKMHNVEQSPKSNVTAYIEVEEHVQRELEPGVVQNKNNVQDKEEEARFAAPPDLIQQFQGQEEQGHHHGSVQSQSTSAGSRTVIYVVGDDEDVSRMSTLDIPMVYSTSPTRSLTPNSQPKMARSPAREIEPPPQAPVMAGYIDEVVGGEFEDPKLYISHL